MGSPDELALTFGALLGLVQGTANMYDRKVHEDVARAHLVSIAQGLAAHAESNRKGVGKVPTLPDSAPPTPAEVPKGEPQPTSGADWAHPTWRAVGFAPAGEVRYRYEVEVARDKKSATVRAVGDLDGDGDRTTLTIGVRIKGSAVEIDAEVTTDNGLE
jgi:hypothetical protein